MGLRSLLYCSALASIAWTPAGQPSALPVPQEAREQTADQQVRQVLNRLAFGPRPGDYEKVRQMGVDAWIDQQLHPERIADPAVTQLVAQLPAYSADALALYKEYPPPGQFQQKMARARTAADSMMLKQQGAAGRQVITELQAARVAQAVVSDRQLEEVLVDFWLNHFSVYAGKNAQMRYHLASYERDVIRPHVLGEFRDLLGAVAHSPAMLIYLDNQLSQADTSRVTLASYGMQQSNGRAGQAGIGGRIGTALVVRGRGGVLGFPRPLPQRGRATGLNENYARELLELHTLGVDGGYTQHDVTEVARALTGWSVLPPQLAQNAANMQRAGATVEGEFVFRPAVHDAESKVVLGVKLKAGRGIEDGEQVLDIVARHPSTAKFIATKLVRRFVSDTPPADLVKRAAETFRKTDGDLREVVRTIVTSPEFFSSAAYRAKVKTPFEVVVSALRAVGAPADLTPRTAQLIGSLGEPVFGRQTPDGWPETGDQWVNTGAILNRINFGIALAAGRVPGTSRASWPLPVGIDNASRDAQVDAVVTAFLGGEVSPETRAVLKEGNNPLLAGTATDSAAMQGERAFRRLPSLEGVPQIVGLALGSPEFQRR